MSPEAEREVLEILRAQKSVPERVEQIAAAQEKLSDAFLLHDAEDKARHDELRLELRGVSRRVGKLEDDAAATGKHELSQLRERLEWWQSIPVRVAGFVAGSVFVAVLGYFIGRGH